MGRTTKVDRVHDRRAQTVDDIVRHVRDEIIAGRLPPGDRLDDRRIATSLDVPRILVREALQRLQRVGLTQTAGARRHRVSDASHQDFRHAIESLVSQFEIALRLALPKMSAPARDFAMILADDVAASCLAVPLSKPIVYERMFAFCDAIVEAAANPVLRVAFDRAWRDLLANSWGSQLLAEEPERIAGHLRDLKDAIATADRASAERTIRSVLTRSPDPSVT